MTAADPVDARLQAAIADDEHCGCSHVPRALGFASMPAGYALMVNADRTHYYWLRHDGIDGGIDWNRWRVRRGAIANAAQVPA